MNETKLEVGLTYFYLSDGDRALCRTLLSTVTRYVELFDKKVGATNAWLACDGYGNIFNREDLTKLGDMLYTLAEGHDGTFLVE